MTQRLSRRLFLASTAGSLCALRRDASAGQPATDTAAALAALEARAGGRLGVCLLDTGSGRLVGHRLDERFAMCSTFKLPLAALVLRAAEAGRLRLDDAVAITKADLVAYAPVVEPKVGQTLTLAALAEAAQTTSDNAAANLLLARLGGPAGFTAALRGLGDSVTRLDRTEPQLNVVKPGEEHDTTSPRAMAATMARLLTGDVLSAASRTPHRLDGRHDDRRQATARGPAVLVARGRQDRHRAGGCDDRQGQRPRHPWPPGKRLSSSRRISAAGGRTGRSRPTSGARRGGTHRGRPPSPELELVGPRRVPARPRLPFTLLRSSAPGSSVG
jgi:beta-lactamase class A